MSFFVGLHGPLSSLFQPLRVPSRTPFPTFGGSLSCLLQRLSGPSPFFVALRGYLFAFSWKSFLPCPTFGGSLSSLLQPLSGPSCPFVEIFFPSCLSWWAFTDPFRVFSNPLESLRGIIFCPLDGYFSPFLEIFSPFPTFGGSLSSLLQPLRGPSCPFVEIFFPSCLSSWAFTDPFRVFSNPLESLRGIIFCPLDGYFSPFLEIFSPFPTFGGSLSSLLQRLSGPSPFFVALRGNLFAFFLRALRGSPSWIPFEKCGFRAGRRPAAVSRRTRP